MSGQEQQEDNAVEMNGITGDVPGEVIGTFAVAGTPPTRGSASASALALSRGPPAWNSAAPAAQKNPSNSWGPYHVAGTEEQLAAVANAHEEEAG